MEKKIIILTIFFTVLFSANTSNATSETELIDSQVEELQINSLIADIEKVTDTEIDLNEVFQKSIKGESSGNLIIKAIETILGKQLEETLKMMVSILLIILIYGMLQNISQNFGNNQKGKIGHFIQILILITVLLKIYAEILKIVKETIEVISSLIYILLPLFMSLSIATRKYYIINRNSNYNTSCNELSNNFY